MLLPIGRISLRGSVVPAHRLRPHVRNLAQGTLGALWTFHLVRFLFSSITANYPLAHADHSSGSLCVWCRRCVGRSLRLCRATRILMIKSSSWATPGSACQCRMLLETVLLAIPKSRQLGSTISQVRLSLWFDQPSTSPVLTSIYHP